MQRVRRHPILSLIAGIALILFLVVAGTGIYAASVAGDLPWQTDPTRIADSITPFAGTDVFIPPTRAPETVATPTP